MNASIDWNAVFVPTLHLGEVVLRGTLTYFFLFAIMRLLRREAGQLGISDLLVVVLIADAAQNGMAGDSHSFTEAAILVATIALWDYFLDWLSFRFPILQPLFRPPPLLLIRNGRLQRQNMKKQMIQEEELMGQLREKGIRSAGEVKQCYLEADGRISILQRSAKAKKN